MERKLVKQGRNALTVTLPAKWLKNKDLKAGDSIYINEKDNNLIIETDIKAPKKETSINVKDSNKSMIFHLVNGKYIEGYDTIKIIHNNPKLMQELSTCLMGMIIDKHNSELTILKNIINTPEDNFESILRRSAHILLQQAKTLELLAKKQAKLEDVKSEERLLDYNIIYCMRYLNKYKNKDSAYKYFLLCSTLESAGDQISLIAKHIGTKKIVAKEIVSIIDSYTKHLFKQNFKELYTPLKKLKSNFKTNSFLDGLILALIETLYNNIGYLFDVKKD